MIGFFSVRRNRSWLTMACDDDNFFFFWQNDVEVTEIQRDRYTLEARRLLSNCNADRCRKRLLRLRKLILFLTIADDKYS